MRHAAVVLPGNGYGPDGPVLLLPTLALEQVGATAVRISYPDRPSAWTEEGMAEFTGEVADRVRAALGDEPWGRVTFIAKSLGTAVLARFSADIAGAAEVRAIWLTPVLGDAAMRAGLLAKAWPSLVAAGSADPYHDAGAARATHS
ncbi:MAG: hypothetical protein ACR2H3_12125 [Acidimicrobiales bacterium]